jgi:hypothetical protein
LYKNAINTKNEQISKITNFLNQKGIKVTSVEDSIISYTHNNPKEIFDSLEISEEEYAYLSGIKI